MGLFLFPDMDSPFGALVGFFAFLSFLLETQLGKSCWVLDFAVIASSSSSTICYA